MEREPVADTPEHRTQLLQLLTNDTVEHTLKVLVLVLEGIPAIDALNVVRQAFVFTTQRAVDGGMALDAKKQKSGLSS